MTPSGTSEYSLLILFDLLMMSCLCCAEMSVIKLNGWELEVRQQIVTTRYGLLYYDYLIRWTGPFIFLSIYLI